MSNLSVGICSPVMKKDPASVTLPWSCKGSWKQEMGEILQEIVIRAASWVNGQEAHANILTS